MTIVQSGRGKAQWLKAEVKGGKLVISIGVDVLAFAAQRHYDEEAFNATEGQMKASEFRVVDAAALAKEVVRELEREAEDGTTRLHLMFDTAFTKVLEQGGEGIEERGVLESVSGVARQEP